MIAVPQAQRAPSPAELGFTRVRNFDWPKSDKSDFGWGEVKQIERVEIITTGAHR